MQKFDDSKSSWDDIEQLFKAMFPDSTVAESFSCAKTKSRFVITYGLKRNPNIIITYGFAPYFLQCLQDELKARPYYII